MRFKVAVFSILLFLTNFLATMIFISSSALFVNHIGASSVSKVIIAFGVITPLVVFFLQKIYSALKKYEYVFLIYTAAFVVFLLGTCYVSYFYSKELSYWIFYILGFAGYSLSKTVSWSLIGRYFNVIDSRRYFPVLTAFQEGGSITAALIIHFILVSCGIYTYVQTGLGAVIIIFAIFLFLLSPRAQAFKAHRRYEDKFGPEYIVDYKKFLKHNRAFILLGGMFLTTVIFEQSLIYELNMTFGKQFNSMAMISSAFAIYKIIESSLVIIPNLFLGRIMNRYVSLGNILIFYSLVITFAITSINVSSLWLLVPVASFMRHSSRYFMFMPSYEQALNSLDSRMRIALKSFFEGFLVPIFIFATGFTLLAFPTQGEIKYLNYILLTVAVVTVVLAIFFKRKYIKFHINRLQSESKEFVIKSIQALGENKNYDAIAPLMDLLTQAESKIVKKNIILSFGRIRINSLLEILFKEAQNTQEELQVAAFESLSRYNSFLVQRFLIDLIHGNTCRSLSARMSLLKILYGSLGNTMVPILMPYLQDEDLRIVANTIESMEPIHDPRILEIITPYLNHQNRRIKGNAVIVLYKFTEMRKQCHNALMELCNSKDSLDKNTFLYIVGRLKLKSYKKYLSDFLAEPVYRVNLALAYCKLEDQMGYELFSDLLVTDDETEIKTVLHHFSQLEDGIKLRILSVYLAKISGEKQKKVLLTALKHSYFDFHEVRDYLKMA